MVSSRFQATSRTILHLDKPTKLKQQRNIHCLKAIKRTLIRKDVLDWRMNINCLRVRVRLGVRLRVRTRAHGHVLMCASRPLTN